MSIGENIKKFRLEKGWTQKKLGEECEPKIAESTIRRYELGKLNPKLETVQKIAEALEVSTTELDPRISTDISSLEQKLNNLRKQRDNFIKTLSWEEFLTTESNSVYKDYTYQIDNMRQQLKELTKNTERQHLYEATGETIRRLRLKKGLSLKDMSDQTQIPKILLYKIENGLRSVTIDTLLKISKCLEVAAVDIDANIALNWGFDFETDEDKLYKQLLDCYEKLNTDGQKKAVEQIKLLALVPQYRAPEPEDEYANFQHENNSPKNIQDENNDPSSK